MTLELKYALNFIAQVSINQGVTIVDSFKRVYERQNNLMHYV